ncbi:zn-c6 fungal-type dna-binding domain protein [Nannochloropsis oceanica]
MAPSRVSKNTCTACRSAKIRCDRAEPSCDRCTKLGITCIEQVRTQGRPRKAPISPMPTESIPCETAPMACDLGSLSPPLQGAGVPTAHINCHIIRSSEIPPSGCCSERCTGGTSTLASIGSTAKSFRRPRSADYPVSSLATDLSHGFANFHNRGQTCKEKTIAVLRAWGLVSGTHRQDSSHGAFNQIVRTLALDHGTAIRVQQRPPPTRDVPAGTPLYGPVILHSSSDSSSISSSSSGSGSVLHAGFRDVDFASVEKAVAFYIIEGGHVQVGVNPLFHSTHMTVPQALALLSHHKMLPVLLWGALFTPASQRKFYGRLSQAIFTAATPVGEMTMDVECVGRHEEEAFWGRATVRHVVEDEGAYASCIISIEPLGVDDARLPPSPAAMTAFPIVGKNKRSSAIAAREGPGERGRVDAWAAGALWFMEQEEKESCREGDDEREWDEEGTAGEDASSRSNSSSSSRSSSSSSSSSSSDGSVRDLGTYGGPPKRRQQKRKCNSLTGNRRSSFTSDGNCNRNTSTATTTSSISSDGCNFVTGMYDIEANDCRQGAYVVGLGEQTLKSLGPLTSAGRANFQQQLLQAWPQQHQQYQQALCTDCGGETSDEEVVDEKSMVWSHLEGQMQQHPQRSQSIGDFQSTLLSLAAVPSQAPILTGSIDACALKQHAMTLKIEDGEEDDECKDEGGAGDFDDLMRYGFDWGLITPSPLMRADAASSGVASSPLLSLTSMAAVVTTTTTTSSSTSSSSSSSSSPLFPPPQTRSLPACQ